MGRSMTVVYRIVALDLEGFHPNSASALVFLSLFPRSLLGNIPRWVYLDQ